MGVTMFSFDETLAICHCREGKDPSEGRTKAYYDAYKKEEARMSREYQLEQIETHRSEQQCQK